MKTDNKIIFLLHLPPAVHGASIVGEQIKNSRIINESFKGRYINLLVSRSVDDTGKTKFLKLIRFFVAWFKLLIELLKEKPDLCYFALTNKGKAFYKDVVLVSLLKLFKVKTVFHLHSKGVKNQESKKLNNLLYRFVFKKSYVILLSKYLYDDIKTFVSWDQVYICPNGVEDLVSNKNLDLPKKTDSVNILFLSNLIKSKGVFVLIKACEILHRKGYNFTCDFVGGEGDVNAQHFKIEVKKKGIDANVKYLGKRYGEDKEKVYKNSDVFVLPTFYDNECFPLVLLEAMQHELPVISTFEGGIRDIVEDSVTGFLVERNDPVALADKLELLLTNKPLRHQMGAAGRLKYEKEFTLQTFETRLQEILQDILLNV